MLRMIMSRLINFSAALLPDVFITYATFVHRGVKPCYMSNYSR